MKVSFQDIRRQMDSIRCAVITSHIHPDGDAVGSVLAMYHVLRFLGKDVSVVMADHVPDCFSLLPGVEVIKSAGEEPGKADLLILLDARMGRCGGVTDAIEAPVLNIDHHVSNDGAADYLFLDPDGSSTCEILYRMFREWDVPMTREIAMDLYAGIATDTGFFRFENTTADSMEIAAELVRLGAEPHILADAVATRKCEDLRLLGLAMESVELFQGGRVVGVFLDERFQDLELTDDLIDTIRFTEGVDIAFLLKYESENVYRVRMRSRVADVSRILAPFGGGGHTHAAGCTLRMGMDKAQEVILQSITKITE